MVCVTNKSEVQLHMLDRELLSAFCVFLENLPRKEELSALLGWRMVYSIMQVLAAEGSTIGEVPRKAAPGGKVWHLSGLLPSVQTMYDGYSHLDRWSVEVGKREARECQAAMPYETASPNGGWIRRGRTGGPHPGDHLNRLLGCIPPRHQIQDSRTGSMKI